VHLQLAFRIPGWRNGRVLAMRLLRRLLSGGGTTRLMLRLREELGLTYHAEANLGLYDDCGVFTIDLAVAPASLVTAVHEVLNILTELCGAAADAAELQRAQRGFLYELEFSRDQADSRANRFGWAELVGYPLSLEQERRQLLALSAAQVREAAAALLRPETLAVALVGPFRDRDRAPVERLLRDFRR
jgi:predicted Zn-dependent peptidase